MRCSRFIPARRSRRPSRFSLRALVGGAVRREKPPKPARVRAVYPREIDHLRRRVEASALWEQVPGFRLELHGQLPSGKNQVGIQHEAPVVPLAPVTVRHHPNARFERWRRDAERQLLPQLRAWRASLPISVPMLMYIWY